jgi:hypothetical protein
MSCLNRRDALGSLTGAVTGLLGGGAMAAPPAASLKPERYPGAEMILIGLRIAEQGRCELEAFLDVHADGGCTAKSCECDSLAEAADGLRYLLSLVEASIDSVIVADNLPYDQDWPAGWQAAVRAAVGCDGSQDRWAQWEARMAAKRQAAANHTADNPFCSSSVRS